MTAHTTKQNGFVVLYLALMIASITAVFAFAVSETGLGMVRSVRLATQDRMLDAYYTSCFEYALMEVRKVPTASFSGTMHFGKSTCNYSVSGNVPSKSADIEVLWNERERTEMLTITQTSPTIELE